uniref:Uncharacterized protein n=1 Tax=Rhizophora mucronata TaxID=61149 RepID=A0A2P2P120_RHIMU
MKNQTGPIVMNNQPDQIIIISRIKTS